MDVAAVNLVGEVSIQTTYYPATPEMIKPFRVGQDG